jgi:anti-sigma factor RsiW
MKRFRDRRASDQLSCREVGKVLQAYLDSALDDLSARRISAHLEGCRRCGLDFEAFTQIKAALERRAERTPEDPGVRRLRAFVESLVSGTADGL